jgi:bisphosphoglycerate-independent phosphoglycerate mutase (AlkP superfamily)
MRTEKVGLVSIAPTVLDLLGLDRPGSMKGESLFPEAALSRVA